MSHKHLKPLLGLTLLAGLLGAAGCTSSDAELVVWTFSTELKEIADNYYTKETGKKVKIVNKGNVTQIKTDLTNAIKRGKNIPDVIALEAAVVANFTKGTAEESHLEDLSAIEGTEQMYPYTKSVATSTDGKLLGLSWQATPGGFFYKKSIATKLGINSPEEMQEEISTWDKYLALAERAKNYDLEQDRDGVQSIAICSSIVDPIKVFLSARENPWVVDGVLKTESVLFGKEEGQQNCFDVVRTLEQEGYTHGSLDREGGWIADIDSDNTLGYFCSSWGLNFDLMPNAKTTKGDWQMCKAPVDYFKGGTWLSVVQNCPNKATAMDFIKYVTTNPDFLLKRGQETGDFMNSKAVMSTLVQDYSCEFLGGQNHLKMLYDVAENINGKLISPYDATIDAEFNSAVGDYAQAICATDDDVENARKKFKASFVNAVKADLPAIIYKG
ncbi:MAG: ABC transporter substrate-binding protein [Bacilli bacterium]|nr:ABC transporter substrate-binding protein [Bacilli bacterium]